MSHQVYLIKKFDISDLYTHVKLSTYRTNRLKSANNPDYINEQYLSEALLRYVLSTFFSFNTFDILENVHKKPFLKDIPLHFSLSHNEHYVVLIVSENKIGIDIELGSRQVKYPIGEYNHPAFINKNPIEKWVLLESAAKFQEKSIFKVLKEKLDHKIQFKLLNYDAHHIGIASFETLEVDMIKIKQEQLSQFLKT